MAKDSLPQSRDSYKFKHGHARGKDKPASCEYYTYISAKGRCRNPDNKHYPYYGGRGIEFRFNSFQEFLGALGLRPSADHSLDRIDVNGHYEVGNVRWATRSQQQNNKTTNHYVTHNGETLTDCEWSRRLGLARNTVRERFRKGWCVPCAVSMPKQKHGRYAGRGCSHR